MPPFIYLYYMKHFLEHHRVKPIMVELPNKQGDNILPVYLSDKNVVDEFSNEYYLSVKIKDAEKFKDYTTKMLEHYIYEYFRYYLKLFSVEGDLYLRFEYL